MLQITIPEVELWDESKKEFVRTKSQTLSLEHSLVSISKWEAKWHKPFISKESKTNEETIDYIRCMTITQNVDQDVYNYLTQANLKEINKYIDDPMTATWFNERKDVPKPPNREQITSELIYYWMIALEIPMDCQRWHLNRLFTLIRICNLKNKPAKKQSKKETLSNNAALNAARKQQLGTSG